MKRNGVALFTLRRTILAIRSILRGSAVLPPALVGGIVAVIAVAPGHSVAANDAIRVLGRVIFFHKKLTWKSTTGLRVLRTLKVPRVPLKWLRPGIVWQGNHSLTLVRVDYTVLTYHFRKGHKTRISVIALPRVARTIPGSITGSALGPVVPVLFLPKKYSSVRRIFVHLLTNGIDHQVFSINLATHLRRWGTRWPNQAYCVAPSNGDWIASIPLPHRAVGGSSRLLNRTHFGFVGYSIHLWNLRSGRPIGDGYPVVEPWAEAFCSPNGRRLGWVCAGHWLRVVNVEPVPGRVQKFRLVASELRTGAFSPGGNRVAMLSNSNRYAGSRVSVIEMDLRSPNVERKVELAQRGAIVACPPKFSPGGGRLTVAAPGKYGERIWILSSKTLRAHAMVTCHGDLIQSIAFSPDGRKLAVEFRFHVLIFQLPKFVARQEIGVAPHSWSIFWTRPDVLYLPTNRPMAPLPAGKKKTD